MRTLKNARPTHRIQTHPLVSRKKSLVVSIKGLGTETI
jgi:hypothetical protein